MSDRRWGVIIFNADRENYAPGCDGDRIRTGQGMKVSCRLLKGSDSELGCCKSPPATNL